MSNSTETTEHDTNTAVDHVPETKNDAENLPPLPDEDNDEKPSKKKKKNNKLLVIIFLLMVSVAGGGLLLASYVNSLLNEQAAVDLSSDDQKSGVNPINPLQVAQGIQVPPVPNKAKVPAPATPPVSPVPVSATVDVPQPEHNNLLKDVGTGEAASSSTPEAEQRPEPAPSSDKPEPKYIGDQELSNRIDLLEKEQREMTDILHSAILKLDQQIKESASERVHLDRQIASMHSKVAKLTKLIQRKQTKTKLKSQLSKPQPPTPLSFALWNGRDTVYVEYPKGKLKMVYAGDDIDGWRVVDIKSNLEKVTYKNIETGQVVERKSGE